MAEGHDVRASLSQLQILPPELHWFCTRKSAEDDSRLFDEDLLAAGRSPDDRGPEENRRVEDAVNRKTLVLNALHVFAYDDDQAATPKAWLETHLAEQLARCDICVREFHRSRRKMKQALQHDYDADEVANFMHKFDSVNLLRIERHLGRATRVLRELQPPERSIRALDQQGVHAVFEALSCKPFHSNEALLVEHFDEFFRHLQTRKPLRLGNYSSAMAWFLFQDNQDRVNWAAREWTRMKASLLPIEFEFVVHDAFVHAMSRVQLDNLDKAFMPRFWEGARLMITRMDKNVITGCLRPMEAQGIETDISRLAYSHLQVDSKAFTSLLATIRHILVTSPTDFWDALGTVSPIAWLDQFFASKALVGHMQHDQIDALKLDSILDWIVPFIESIRPANRPPAARTLLTQLLGKYQTENYAASVNKYCLLLGSKTLSMTLRGLQSIDNTSMVVHLASDVITMTEDYLPLIAPLARSQSADPETTVDVLHQAIFLDGRCFVASGKAKDSKSQGTEGIWIPHVALLQRAASSLDYGNMRLAKKLLAAMKPLGGTEDFVTKARPIPQAHVAYNSALRRYSSPICDILDRIGEFGSSDIRTIFADVDSAYSMSLLLVSSDQGIRSAALEVVKILSCQTTRRDAVGFLLTHHCSMTLHGLTLALGRLEKEKPFEPTLAALRYIPDVVEALCNQQDGHLRTSGLTRADKQSSLRFWQTAWKFTRMMFNNTEAWSRAGHDKAVLMNFCRDAMDFADRLFDQFAVFKGALRTNKDEEDANTDDSLARQLLEEPKSATNDAVKWLRLRDEYLVSKSTALVCRLLTRLHDYEEKVSEASLEFVIEVIVGTAKSTVSPQQKAELSRALEVHAGISMDSEDSDTAGTNSSAPRKRSGVIDLDAWTSRAAARDATTDKDEAARLLAAASPAYEKLKTSSGIKLPGRPAPQAPINRKLVVNANEFKKKREREMAEKKRRDALVMAHQNKKAIASVAGEGSGARGLGKQGKEHDSGPKGSEMYVDSASEDDSDDDAMDEMLFGEKKARNRDPTKPTLTKAEAEAIRRQRQGPVKKQRLVRSHRDMRARLAPDLSSLHKSILGWEYFYDGGFPPGSQPSDYAAVVSKFRDASDYQRTFQALLVLEAWNGFLKAKEENNSRPYGIKLLLRSSVDAFLEVSSTMSPNDAKDVSEGDIVLLSTASNPATASDEPHCLSRIARITRKKATVDVIYRTMPGTRIAPQLSGGSTIYGLKVMSVIPLEREYGALLGLQYYDLCDEITRGIPSPLLKYGDETLLPHMKNYGVNKAQAKAIKSALDNDAFTLIQGPPGSGKTKTIVALCGALLTSSLKVSGSNGHLPRTQAPQQPGAEGSKKMLVCAPSNAAVDELVMRFKDGIRTTTGEHRKISVVRLGRSDAINVNVQDVTLEELINRKLNIASDKNRDARGDTQKVMMEHKDVSDRLRSMREKVDEAEASGGVTKELSDEFAALRRQKAHLSQKVDAAKDQEGAQNRQADINRRRAQQEVLESADVICATLSGSGHDMFQNLNIEFETVVVDEAAQCVELSCLIPLKYGCAKCVLVGDPQQLPPTVFSKDAARFKYEQSLFVRMQENHPEHVHLLDTQYRMHPEISAFPSKAFYDSRLLDGKDMAGLRARPWHDTTLLSPFRFFDVQGQHQAAPRGHSLINNAEINIAIRLYDRLISDFRSYDFTGKIGIITPYKSQLRELKEQFKRAFGADIVDAIEFNTTDAFQGRESEIIIFSCVRASPAGGIGFLQDIRRMNVGLTRAKSSLWVLGNSQSLIKGPFWEKLVKHSINTKSYTDGNLEAMLDRPLTKVRGIADGAAPSPKTKPTPTDASTGTPRRQSSTMNFDPVTKPKPKPKVDISVKSPTVTARVNPKPPPAPPVIPRSNGTPKATSTGPAVGITPHAKPKRKHSSDSDVEMTDAPAEPPAKKPATAANKDDTAKNALALEVKPSAENKVVSKPAAPLPPRKKAAASVFIKKKPPR